MDDGFGGWVWLIAGLLYLLGDYSVSFVSFWQVQWWTLVFLVMGVGALMGKKK